MKPKEYSMEVAKAGVAREESRVRQAQRNLDEGYKKLCAQVEIAIAEREREYSNLKEELERAKTDLSREKKYLEFQQAELERGFDA